MPKRKKTQSKRERKRAIQAVERVPDVVVIDSVQSAPVSSNLIEAVRKELVRLVEMPNHESNLGQIARFARAADDMLVIVKSPEAVMRDEHTILGATALTVPTGSPETYGASILRQLIPALQDFRKSQNETPEAMVHAITLARRNGMTDVAAELEKKLTGKSLDGDRPVKKDAFGIDSYLTPPLAPLPTDESGPQPVILGKDPLTCDAIYPRTRDGRCQGCGVVGEHPKKGATKTNGKNGSATGLNLEFTPAQRGQIFNEIAHWLGIDGQDAVRSPHEKVSLIGVRFVDEGNHEYLVTEIKDQELNEKTVTMDSIVKIVESAVTRDAATRFGDCVYVLYFHLAGGQMNRGRYPFVIPGSGHLLRGTTAPPKSYSATSRKAS